MKRPTTKKTRSKRPAPPPRRAVRSRSTAKLLGAGVGVPAELTDARRGLRLQKVMAEAGVASRRACEQLIAAGRVTVNGQPVTSLPAWVDPTRDRVLVDGRPIARPPRKPTTATHTYIMLHKSRGVISTARDPQGRRTVLDLGPAPGSTLGNAAFRGRLFPVGRLDADSTGLILLTDDGEFAHHLTHPRFGLTKEYLVSIKGRVSDDDLTRLKDGLYLAHHRADAATAHVRKAAMENVRLVRHERDAARGDRTTLAITLHEGQNRQIRRMLARLGFKVRRLKRVAIGPLRLKGLAVGAWRPLTAAELRLLRRAADLAPPR